MAQRFGILSLLIKQMAITGFVVAVESVMLLRAESVKKLSPQRPASSVFAPEFFSLMGQFAVHVVMSSKRSRGWTTPSRPISPISDSSQLASIALPSPMLPVIPSLRRNSKAIPSSPLRRHQTQSRRCSTRMKPRSMARAASRSSTS